MFSGELSELVLHDWPSHKVWLQLQVYWNRESTTLGLILVLWGHTNLDLDIHTISAYWHQLGVKIVNINPIYLTIWESNNQGISPPFFILCG